MNLFTGLVEVVVEAGELRDLRQRAGGAALQRLQQLFHLAGRGVAALLLQLTPVGGSRGKPTLQQRSAERQLQLLLPAVRLHSPTLRFQERCHCHRLLIVR